LTQNRVPGLLGLNKLIKNEGFDKLKSSCSSSSLFNFRTVFFFFKPWTLIFLFICRSHVPRLLHQEQSQVVCSTAVARKRRGIAITDGQPAVEKRLGENIQMGGSVTVTVQFVEMTPKETNLLSSEGFIQNQLSIQN